MSVAAYTSVCEADARWVEQYLTEIERMGTPFAIHLDKCGHDLRRRLISHSMCIGNTSESSLPFNEKHKQGILDIVADKGYDWAMPWDIDETWDKNAPATLRELEKTTADYLMLGWVNLWDNPQTLRIDGPFKNLREKLYNLRSGPFKYLSTIVNGPKLMHRQRYERRTDVICARRWEMVCLHWGFLTRELREEHKQRWDAIYAEPICGGKNPYGIWDWALNEKDYPPRLCPNEYL